jgi:hypothetical protein
MIHSIHVNEKDLYFFHSLFNSKLLSNSIVSLITNKDKDKPSIFQFYAKSVEQLNILDYNSVLKMMWCLNIQNTSLVSTGYGFYCLSLEDILVIDSDIFICVNPNISKMVQNGIFTFNLPFSRNTFISPEILKIKSIPASVSCNCFYYSLGALAVYCLTGIKMGSDLSILEPISQTKLYWTILKCLNLNCEKRCLLFI